MRNGDVDFANVVSGDVLQQVCVRVDDTSLATRSGLDCQLDSVKTKKDQVALAHPLTNDVSGTDDAPIRLDVHMFLAMLSGDVVVQGKVTAEHTIAYGAANFWWKSRWQLDGDVLHQLDLAREFAIVFQRI